MKTETGQGLGTAARYFASKRPFVALALERLAGARGAELSGMPGGGPESLGRIVEFCLRGKMIRGCLVFLAAEAASAAESASAAVAGAERLAGLAAAMELFQAGLLAHDDIMDRDQLRRGAPTLHARYATESLAGGATDYAHVGESLGICLGDICFFEAFAELARSLAASPSLGRILALCSSGLSEVAVAQMADVRWGAARAEIPEDEILAMYRSKTAHYSFSLPLAVGALFAGADALVAPLTLLGEELGLLFQIRDDELGLFGDEAITGKGLGSDLREGKKTLFRSRLLAAAPRRELGRLGALFGGGSKVEAEDLAYIRGLARELGVAASIDELSGRAEARARAIIRDLPGLAPESAPVLEALVDYVAKRER